MSQDRLNYQKILEMSTVGMALFSSEFHLLYANDNFVKILDVSREKLNHSKFEEFIELSDSQNTLLKENKASVLIRDNILCKHPNGEYSSLFATIKRVDIPHETHPGYFVELFNTNIETTSQTTALGQLNKIGKVVSQISHDISNPLAIMRIHCDSFTILATKQENISSKEVQKRVTKINDATDRVTNSTKELRYFARKLLEENSQEIEEIWEKTTRQDGSPLPHRED